MRLKCVCVMSRSAVPKINQARGPGGVPPPGKDEAKGKARMTTAGGPGGGTPLGKDEAAPRRSIAEQARRAEQGVQRRGPRGGKRLHVLSRLIYNEKDPQPWPWPLNWILNPK